MDQQKIIDTLKDCADFIGAIVVATESTGRIDENSILRYGERLKTTARKLDAKCKKVLARESASPNRPKTNPDQPV